MQRNWLRSLFLLTLVVQFVGCATITRGTKEVLVVESSPPGADVRTSTGLSGKTPASFKVNRRGGFVVSIEKQGYEKVEVQVESQVAGGGAAGMAGNVILGGLIGAALDAGSGAMLELKPNPIRVDLVPLAVAPIPPLETQDLSKPMISKDQMVNPPPETQDLAKPTIFQEEVIGQPPDAQGVSKQDISQEELRNPPVSSNLDVLPGATLEDYKNLFPYGSDPALVEQSLGPPNKEIEFERGRILYYNDPKIKITVFDGKVITVNENVPL